MSSSSRDEALESIAKLARDNDLSIAEIQTALGKQHPDEATRQSNTLESILGFLGGIFIFAGLGVFIALNWDGMNAAARIIITLGSGIAAFVIAAVGERQGGAQRFTVPLFLIAALLQPTGILVAIGEFSTGGDWHYAAITAAGIMAIQQGLALWQFRKSTLVFTTLFFGLWVLWISLDLLEVDEDLVALLLGASTIGICLGLEHTEYRGVNPFWFFFGSAGFFGGLFALVRGSATELIFVIATCGGVFLSVLVRSRTLLFTSTMAMLAYIAYFTGEHFLESVGWPILLIVLGLLLIGLSAAAMKINRRYISA